MSRRTFLKQSVAAVGVLSLPALLAACGSDADLEKVEAEDKKLKELMGKIREPADTIKKRITELPEKFKKGPDAKTTLNHIGELRNDVSALFALASENGEAMQFGTEMVKRAQSKVESLKEPVPGMSENIRSKVRDKWQERVGETTTRLDAIRKAHAMFKESLALLDNAKKEIEAVAEIKLPDIPEITKKLAEDLNKTFR